MKKITTSQCLTITKNESNRIDIHTTIEGICINYYINLMMTMYYFIHIKNNVPINIIDHNNSVSTLITLSKIPLNLVWLLIRL